MAQPYFPVTHPYGVKTVNGVNVTITTFGAVNPANPLYAPNTCSFSIFHQPGFDGTSPGPGAHVFSFWPRIKGVRLNMFGFDNGDTLEAYIDGSKHNVLSSDILNGDCAHLQPIAAGGNICGPNSGTLSGRAIIAKSTSFDSIRLEVPTTGAGGVGYNLAYTLPDTGVNIFEPFIDSAKCEGEVMYVGYAAPYHFYSGNSFTIQLSEPNGGFNSFTILGVRYATDTYGVITCPIPIGIVPSANYRLRVVSTAPARISQPSFASISIGVYPPKPDASSNSPVCESHTLSLNVAGQEVNGYTYTWKGPNGWYGYQKNTLRPNTTLTYAGQYIVDVSSYGCGKSDTINVVVNTGPGPVTASSNSPVCFGDTLKLRSTAALPSTTYEWSGPALPPTAGQNYNVLNVFTGGKYAITATLNNCTYSDTVEVTLKALPATSAPFNNGPLCRGDTLKLNIGTTAGAVYTWVGPDTTIVNPAHPILLYNFEPGQEGKYVVYASVDGCSSKDSTTVVIKPSPAKPTATSNTPVCKNSRIYLYSSNTTPGVTYSWKGPANFNPSIQNPFVSNVDFSREGNYTVTASLNGCIDTAITFVKVEPIPLPKATTNGSICAGDTIRISVTDTLAGTTFSWTGPDNYTSTTKDTLILNATIAQTGYYVVTSQYSICKNTDTVHMLVKPMPDTPVATNNSVLCAGKELQISAAPITAGADITWTGPGGFTSTEQDITIANVQLKDSGNYAVVVDIDGCYLRDSTRVLIEPTPDLTILSNSPVSAGKPLEFEIPNHLPGTVYNWTGPNGFASRAQNPIIFPATPAANGRYIVVGKLGNCEATDAIIITVNEVADTGVFVFYPNPNNGTFTVFGLLKADQKLRFEIYNGAGQFIYAEHVESINKTLRATITMPHSANGKYYLRFRLEGKMTNIPFIISR